MLDLGKVKQQLYKLKLEDGTELKIKKPTQAMLNKIIQLSNLDKEDSEEAFDKIFEVLTDIFNRNTQKKEFSQEDIENMLDAEIAMMVIEDYMKDIYKELGK